MVTEITSKSELEALVGKLKNESTQLSLDTTDISSNLSQAEDYDGIGLSQAASSIKKNLKRVSSEADSLITNIGNYISEIKELDTYDFKNSNQSITTEELLDTSNKYYNFTNNSLNSSSETVNRKTENEKETSNENTKTVLATSSMPSSSPVEESQKQSSNYSEEIFKNSPVDEKSESSKFNTTNDEQSTTSHNPEINSTQTQETPISPSASPTTSQEPSANKTGNKTSNINPIPLLSGLGLTAAAGVGVKVYLDKKKKNSKEESLEELSEDNEIDEFNLPDSDLIADEWQEENDEFEDNLEDTRPSFYTDTDDDEI